MNKRLLPVLIALLAVLFLFAPGAMAATENGFTYSVTGGCATITSYSGYDSELVIPDTLGGYPVTEIGNSAFLGCTSLTSVTIPDSVTTLGSCAFEDCTSLTSVTIPDSVTTLGSYAFEGCTNLTSITFGSGLTSIGSHAFQYCTSLSSISFGSGLTSIGSHAFDECTSLTSITFGSGLISIGSSAFCECTSLTSVTIPDSVTTLGSSAFYECTSLTSITFGSSLTSIGSYAFYECTSLSSITFGSGLTSIGSYAFYNCTALQDVHAPSLNAWIGIEFDGYYATPMRYAKNLYIGGELLSGALLLDGVTSVGSYAFYNCTTLTSVTFPDSLTSIGQSAFSGCTKIASVTLGSGLTSVGESAFYNCSKLKKVYVPTLEAWMNIQFSGWSSTPTSYAEDLYVGGAPLKTLVIPEGTTAIGEHQFENCRSLTSVTLPASLTSIGEYAFDGCNSIKEVRVPSLSAWLAIELGGSSSNPLRASGAENRTLYIGSRPLERLVIPEGTTAIDAYRFHGCTTLVSVSFPDTLESVGYEAFEGCRNLKSVTLPPSVHTIEGYAFSCGEDCEITLPDNVTKIGDYAFGYNNSVAIVNPDSATMAALLALDSPFTHCDPADPDWLWYYDEEDTRMLGGYRGGATSITLPAGETAIADNAFNRERNEKLLSIIIPEGYESIGRWAFDRCNYLAHITLPSTLRTIGEYAFCHCDFTSIQLPEGLETLEENAFLDCDDLTSLTIPSTVTNIPDVVADSCDELTTVVLPAEIEYIAPGAFGESLSTVYCYRDTYAQEWAKENSPLVRLIGDNTLEGLVTLTAPDTYWADDRVFEVGNTYPFMAGVTVGTLPFGADYTFTCVSSAPSVARVDGELLTFLKPGTATLTIGIAERPDVATIKRTISVYHPVTAFTVPEALFVHIDATTPAYLIPEGIEPTADANPYFRRRDVGSGWWGWCNVKVAENHRAKGIYFYPEDNLGAVRCEIESMSGVTQPMLFVTYDEIGEVYADPPARPLVIGEIWEPDVTVMVDGAELEKLSYLYTLKTSNKNVAAITADEMIKAVAPGTATITVTARNSGRTAKFAVTVTEAVTLYLPASLAAVPDEAFVGAAAGEVVIPDGCASIGSRAFADCANLYAVTIPASVTDIAADAFENCAGVTVTAAEGSAAAQMFDGMEGFTVVTQ